MRTYARSQSILERNRHAIPGGLSSLNRLTEPAITFVRGEGAHLWDADGNEYIDYHGAFAPQFLGYGHPRVVEAVKRALDEGLDLFGSGASEQEGRLAELMREHLGWADSAAFFNSGSEATAQAIRLARAATGRDHIIVMQGGYNGWHNDVACNLMTPLETLGPRVCPGEYPFLPISAGIPQAHRALIHPVNFNDIRSVRWVCERYPVAALITEPILQNVGLIHPQPGYLEALRSLSRELGFLLIFDEIKTGFRHGLGGYAGLSGVQPDLAVYGKAIASGYPLAAIAGRAEHMDLFAHRDPSKRVLLAGTYNAHPVPVAAAIATIEALAEGGGDVYRGVERLGARMEAGLRERLSGLGRPVTVVRQGSAFVAYFMDHAPRDWHDLAEHHDFTLDNELRRRLLEKGVYFFPLAVKQCSLSTAHGEAEVDSTLEAVEAVVEELLRAPGGVS
ncbi:MAG: aspartate aminotransferase family protein [Bryobacterales bacterium]|nr:aspartate aminotransferase family protein [Acidobacteriota bacterium]MCB9384162.1 aspartate aminotransferase family protein [Bryobacterales bacterium]